MFYRERLRQELERRKANNPRYSLSALARDIGLTPAAVSLVLSGQRHFSRKTLVMIGQILNWSESDLNEALIEVDLRPRKGMIGRKRGRGLPLHTVQAVLPSLADVSDFMKGFNSLVKSFSDRTGPEHGGERVTVVVQVFSALAMSEENSPESTEDPSL